MTSLTILTTFFSTFILLQGTATPRLLQIGPIKLNADDVASLTRLLPDGKAPWVIDGNPEPILGRLQMFAVYQPPTISSAMVRRGTLVFAAREATPTSAWTLRPSQAYAQVAVTGRDFEDVRSADDINRPFRVMGNIADAELVEVVAFARRTLDSSRPLSSVEESAGSVRVYVRHNAAQSHFWVLEREGQAWKVVREGVLSA